jgi:hypothetical protein
MNTIIKFGLAALAAGAFSTLPSKAETPDTFTRHALPIPGAYFKNQESQQPVQSWNGECLTSDTREAEEKSSSP